MPGPHAMPVPAGLGASMRVRASVCLALALLAVPAGASPPAPGVADARIEDLLRRMTIEEKAGQLNQLSAGLPTGPGTRREPLEPLIAAGRVGSLLNVEDGARANAYQRIAVGRSRLRIPLLFALDVIHGYRTIVPIPLGLAASWDPSLIEAVARLAATESASEGVRWTFSPMVDVARDARWGRIAEGAGEDPFLGSALAAAWVRGYQGERLDEPTSILACAKHFVGYGASEGGREYNTTDIPERTLREVHLPPFAAAVRAGVATVMAGFNALDGVPASANGFTLGRVLRGEWGFAGLVVSDWESVRETIDHGIAEDLATAAHKAFQAGVDVDMESRAYLDELPGLVRSGAVPVARLDEAVRRMLRLKAALGLFEHPYAPGGAPSRGPLPAASLDLARRAAEASFVLLRNEAVGGVAPLPIVASRVRTIALLGPLADDAVDMLGSWSARGRPPDVVTLRTALATRARREGMELLYAPGIGDAGPARALALDAAARADLVVVALGEKGEWTGEAASRTRLDLPADQQALLQDVAATGKPVVLVLFNGRPLTIPWAAQHVPAILEAWFPGVQAGPALVRTLFGDVDPAGRLTATFPRTVGQEPLYYDALSTGRPPPPDLDLDRPPRNGTERFVSRYIDESNAPQFPFGYGLSYTTFRFGPVEARVPSIDAAAVEDGGGIVTVAADVTNTGARRGTTVVQLYIRLTGTSVARPVRELKGFRRIELDPGETRRVSFDLGRAELAFRGLRGNQAVEPATLSVWIAPDSTAGSPVRVRLTGSPRTGPAPAAPPSPSSAPASPP